MEAITLPATTEIDYKAIEAVSKAKEMIIEDDLTYQWAGEFLKGLKGIAKEITETFQPSIEAAHLTHKKILEAKKRHSEPIDQAEIIVKGKMGDYLEEQDRIGREEQARIAAEERKRAEEARLREAAHHEKGGDHEAAQAVLEQAIDEPIAPVVLPSAPKVAGISTVERWDYQIINPNIIPREYLIVDSKKMARVVTAMKGQTNIPGVRVFKKTGIAAKAG